MDILQKIKSCIEPIISIDDNDWSFLSQYIYAKEIAKNQLLLQENKICDFIAFINKGTLIYYKNQDNGDEVTTDFAFENDWVTNNHSRINKTPSHLNIKAIEDSQLLIINQDKLDELYLKIPAIEHFGRILIEQAYVKLVQLSIDLQTLSATDRYFKLLEERPDILQRVPLYHIANYLGIAPKSLSRIRNSIFRRN